MNRFFTSLLIVSIFCMSMTSCKRLSGENLKPGIGKSIDVNIDMESQNKGDKGRYNFSELVEASSSMDTESKKAGISIDTDGLIHLLGPDYCFVNSMVSNIKDLRYEDFIKGADVGFFYLRVPRNPPIKGYYGVKIYQNIKDKKFYADFFDNSRKTSFSSPVEVTIYNKGYNELQSKWIQTQGVDTTGLYADWDNGSYRLKTYFYIWPWAD